METSETFRTYSRNIVVKHVQHPYKNACNIRLKQMKYFEQTLATWLWNTCNICNIPIYFCSNHTKHLQHTSEISENTWNIHLQHMRGEIGAGWFRPRGASTTSTGHAHKCPWLGRGLTWDARCHHEHQQRWAARPMVQERAARVSARRVGLREPGARGAGGCTRWVGARSEQHKVGRVQGDGCGGKCGVRWTDDHMAPWSVRWMSKWIDIFKRDVKDIKKRQVWCAAQVQEGDVRLDGCLPVSITLVWISILATTVLWPYLGWCLHLHVMFTPGFW
jgi:hypothetical protein